MNLKDLLDNIKYTSNEDISQVFVSNITHTIEKVTEKTLLVTFKNPDFIDMSKVRASAIICSSSYKGKKTHIPTVFVDNPRYVYAILASRLANINYEFTEFIAVTGTNGKTTTATMIFEIMKSAGISVGMIGTGKITYMNTTFTDCNYSMTTPDPDLLYNSIKRMQDMGCKLIVMEVSSHALALQKVAPIKFKISIFTSLSPEHMDFHTDMEEYYKAKLTLFNQSLKGIFNADDLFSSRAMKDCSEICEVLSIGVIWDAESMARDVLMQGLKGSTYIYREQNLIFRVKLQIPGYYNIYNSMLAIKCAIEYGIAPYIAKEAINSIKSIPGRCEVICNNPCVIIDYAHTELAFEGILKTISTAKLSGQTLYTVFGCGGERDKEKRPRMARIAQRYSDKVIITSDNPRNENPSEIINDILEGISDHTKREVIPDRKLAIEYAIKKAKHDDIVLILGKGHEKYIIDNSGYHPFNERAICEMAMQERNNIKNAD